MNEELLELYSDYLLTSFGETSATGLSAMLDGAVSHDKVTRFLAEDDYDSRTLWKHVKLIESVDHSGGRLKRRSEVTKNELMRRMLRVCRDNGPQYRYVLADSWFSSKQNMAFIHDELGRQFVIVIKSNAALSRSLCLTSRRRLPHLSRPTGCPRRR